MKVKNIINAMASLAEKIHDSILCAAATGNFILLGRWAYLFEMVHEESMMDYLNLISYETPNPYLEELKKVAAKYHIDIQSTSDVEKMFNCSDNVENLCSAIVETSSILYAKNEQWVENLWRFCPLYIGDPEEFSHEDLAEYALESLEAIDSFIGEMKHLVHSIASLPPLFADDFTDLETICVDDEEADVDEDVENLIAHATVNIETLMKLMEEA